MTLKSNWQSGDSFTAGDANDLATVANGAEQTSRKGQANGYASLDSNGRVPVSQLPNSVMEYQGVWNASTNTPTLADATGNAGDVYRVTVSGARNLGSGSIDFVVGDYVIYDGSVWQKADTTDAVATVAGRTGNVTLSASDVSGVASLTGAETLTNKTVTSGKFNTLLDTNGNEALRVNAITATTGANYLSTGPTASGTGLTVTATGTDTNVGLDLATKGSGAVTVNTVPVVTTSATQTLTNKTLTSPTMTAPVLGTAASGNVAACVGQVADMSIVCAAAGTTRAVGTNDFPFGVQVQRSITLSSVTYRVATADGSGSMTVELRKNGATLSGSAATVAYGSQVVGGTATGTWSLVAGDIVTVYITAIGSTPGKGLVADIKGLTA